MTVPPELARMRRIEDIEGAARTVSERLRLGGGGDELRLEDEAATTLFYYSVLLLYSTVYCSSLLYYCTLLRYSTLGWRTRSALCTSFCTTRSRLRIHAPFGTR